MSLVAGKVIGKKGIVIANLQRETQTSLMTVMKVVKNSLWVPLVILGSMESVSAAYEAAASIVDNGLSIFYF